MLMYDLCCGGGGVARVALEMGWRVIGVDNEPQPDYPGEFILADALKPPLRPIADLVWASPNCEGYSPLHYSLPHIARARDVNLFRPLCQALGKHYVIENANTCPDLIDPVKLCGFMFGRPFIRHRKFEASFLIPQPKHVTHRGKWIQTTAHGKHTHKEFSEAMGLNNMANESLGKAVPSVYTQFILTWFLVRVKE